MTTDFLNYQRKTKIMLRGYGP